MRSPDFNLCYDICVLSLPKIRRSEPDAQIVFGEYLPNTSFETWDERWQALYKSHGANFVHFWIETETQIIDYACMQFGGPSVRITDSTDSRYIRMGRMEGKEKLQEWGEIHWMARECPA